MSIAHTPRVMVVVEALAPNEPLNRRNPTRGSSRGRGNGHKFNIIETVNWMPSQVTGHTRVKESLNQGIHQFISNVKGLRIIKSNATEVTLTIMLHLLHWIRLRSENFATVFCGHYDYCDVNFIFGYWDCYFYFRLSNMVPVHLSILYSSSNIPA